jgi:hypothetical protein
MKTGETSWLGQLRYIEMEPDGICGFYLSHPFAPGPPRTDQKSLKNGDVVLILGHNKGYYHVLTKIGPGWLDRVFFQEP